MSRPEAGGARSSVPWVLAAPLLLLFLAPLVLLAARSSPAVVWRELGERETQQAIALSLATSSAAMVGSIVLGLPLAYALARSRGRGARIIDALVDLPTVLPPAVAGVALLLAFGRNGAVGGLLSSVGINVAFTPAAVVIAQVFVAAPYFVRAARAGLASVDRELSEAAVIDGAVGWARLRHVLGPSALPSLGAGAAMCWSRALGEFGATIIFAGNLPGRTQTMPLAVYVGFETSLDRALVLSAVMIGVSLLVLVGVRQLGPRGG